MNFVYTKKINSTFDMTLDNLRFALNDEWFGIVSNIDVSEKIVTKINSDFDPYRVLWVCNPEIAHKYLKVNMEFWVFMPCSISIYEKDWSVFVSASLPEILFWWFIKDEKLNKLNQEIGDVFKKVIDSL